VRFITRNGWRQDLRAECHRRFDQTGDAGGGLGVADDGLD
jgi:hypothetical protein